MIEKTLNTAIISIGSNINPDANIREMFVLLAEKVEIIRISPLIKTKPIGIADQPDFTNGGVEIRTILSENDLIRLLKDIEDQMGRDRSAPKFGPRVMDLDLVVWNGKILDPDYYTRDFLKKMVDGLM